MRKIWMGWMVVAILSGGLACAQSQSGQVVGKGQARTAQKVLEGTVIGVQTTTIEADDNGAGGLAGGALGAAAASGIGRGAGRRTAVVGGAIVGSRMGRNSQKRRNTKEGLEILVKLESGETLAVIQEADVPFRAGDPVLLLVSPDGTTRVRPNPAAVEKKQ